MALKLKIACYLGIFTGLLTFFLSLMYQIRPVSALYRGGFTAVLFFGIGYVVGIFAESYWKKLLEKYKDSHKGKNVDITDKADSDVLPEEPEAAQVAPGTNFKPLNPDELMSLSPKQE